MPFYQNANSQILTPLQKKKKKRYTSHDIYRADVFHPWPYARFGTQNPDIKAYTSHNYTSHNLAVCIKQHKVLLDQSSGSRHQTGRCESYIIQIYQ